MRNLNPSEHSINSKGHSPTNPNSSIFLKHLPIPVAIWQFSLKHQLKEVSFLKGLVI